MSIYHNNNVGLLGDFNSDELKYWEGMIKKFPKDANAKLMLENFKRRVAGQEWIPSQNLINYNLKKSGQTLPVNSGNQTTNISNDSGMNPNQNQDTVPVNKSNFDITDYLPWIVIGGAVMLFAFASGREIVRK